MYEEGLAFLHLMGKVYLVLRTPQEGCNPFDSHMLPKQVLFDGAAKDFGEDYAEQLVAFRSYFNEYHPLSRRLRLARDMPGERIDLNSVVRWWLMVLQGTVSPTPTSPLGLREGRLTCPAPLRRRLPLAYAHLQNYTWALYVLIRPCQPPYL
jgi:hypothetical protein